MTDRLAELQELQDRLNALMAAEGGVAADERAPATATPEHEPEPTEEERNAEAAQALAQRLGEVAEGRWYSVKA